MNVDRLVYSFIGGCFIVSWIGFRMLHGFAEAGADAIDSVCWGDDEDGRVRVPLDQFVELSRDE